jgi:alanine-synthesizing transaminase
VKPIAKSSKLADVGYDIRGPVLEKARQMQEGATDHQLNIGNLAVFGFDPPDEIVQDMIRNLPHAGYTDQRPVRARASVCTARRKTHRRRRRRRCVPCNSASELIAFTSMRCSTRATRSWFRRPTARCTVGVLSGGTPVHYLCDEQSTGCPIWPTCGAGSRRPTRSWSSANNPTGALYPGVVEEEIVDIARRTAVVPTRSTTRRCTTAMHKHRRWLTTCCSSHSTACRRTIAPAASPAGWWCRARAAKDYIEGLNMLSSMRLCQHAGAAGHPDGSGLQSIKDLVAAGCKQRAWPPTVDRDPGRQVVKPRALYMFPRLDPKIYPIADDQQFAYELLAEEKVLIVQGTGFNWPRPDHFRLVFLPNPDDLTEAIGRIERFLNHYRQRSAK